MSNLKISKRLRTAAELCREGSRVADVGTDHAYLPIYLLTEGKITGGVVTDINKGPIDRAIAHIREYGADQKLTAIHCDGLSAVAPCSVDDIFILGMGGELIADIVAAAEWTKNKDIRLILQPMTHPEAVRGFLWDNGYRIVAERFVFDEKIYQVIAAEYCGERESYNELELMFGKINLEEKEPLLFELFSRTERVMKERIKGKNEAGADTRYEENIIKMMGEIK